MACVRRRPEGRPRDGGHGDVRTKRLASTSMRAPDNREIADVLEEVAALLTAQDANPFRARAYREAARTIRTLGRGVTDVLAAEGRAGLEALPGIGKSLASAIAEIASSGRLALLDRMRGAVAPEDLFTTLPGVGDALAHRIHDVLGVETLEELELAAHDGRLEALPGFGSRRVRLLRDVLAARLSRSARSRARRIDRHGRTAPPHPERPDVETLLGVDAEYRRGAEADTLRRIAPRRFNPTHAAWLPLLHTERDGWSFQAMFSNTARAHELDRTRDWVVLYFERDGHEDQCTVVTETRGPLTGLRVVRGREDECARLHAGEEVHGDTLHA